MTLKIGLTGGIGSGKTVATRLFANLGIDIVDADQIARDVVHPGQPALSAIADYFGARLLQTDGQLDRNQLRRIIFANPDAKLWLEQLLHPLIDQHIEVQLTRANGLYALMVSPLLLETNQQQLVERVIVVDALPAQQLARTRQRDHDSVQQIEAIMATQMDRQQRLQLADHILCNQHSQQHLMNQVYQLHTTLCKIASQKP
jgi:dephospho-CoA kinase